MRYKEPLRERSPEKINIVNNIHGKLVSTRKREEKKRRNIERKRQERKEREGGLEKMMIIEKIEQEGNTNKEERSKGEGKEKRKQ